MLPYLATSPSCSQTQFLLFAHTADSSHLTHKQVQLTEFTEHTYQTLGFCQLMELNWLPVGTSTKVTEVAGVHDLQWVQLLESIDLLERLNILQDLATNTWHSKSI